METTALREILASQRSDLVGLKPDIFIRRTIDLSKEVNAPEISVITGVRRCGKSALLENLLRTNYELADCLYLNFEDPRLSDFHHADFQKVYEIWLESERGPGEPRVAVFDEIQNVLGWEPWMNFFSKQKRFKVYLTGSNSKLLASELATHLTGRQTQVTLFPLSFKEIAEYEADKAGVKIRTGNYTDQSRIWLTNLMKDQLKFGSFPRSWLSRSSSILAEYYQNIVARDIAQRKKIRDIDALDKFGRTIMSNVGRKINKSRIAQSIGLKSSETVDRYLKHFNECYLGFSLEFFDQSVRRQIANQAKFYAIDPAMAARVSLPSDSKEGFYFENLILLELLRQGARVYYWSDSGEGEVDFVVETSNGQRVLIQAAWSIENPDTLNRELRGFELFAKSHKALKIHKQIILTAEGGEQVLPGGVSGLPFFHWALSE